jgi:hypothetical protein
MLVQTVELLNNHKSDFQNKQKDLKLKSSVEYERDLEMEALASEYFGVESNRYKAKLLLVLAVPPEHFTAKIVASNIEGYLEDAIDGNDDLVNKLDAVYRKTLIGMGQYISFIGNGSSSMDRIISIRGNVENEKMVMLEEYSELIEKFDDFFAVESAINITRLHISQFR